MRITVFATRDDTFENPFEVPCIFGKKKYTQINHKMDRLVVSWRCTLFSRFSANSLTRGSDCHVTTCIDILVHVLLLDRSPYYEPAAKWSTGKYGKKKLTFGLVTKFQGYCIHFLRPR